MKRILAISASIVAMMLSSCDNSTLATTTQPTPSGEGKVALTLKLGTVGMLARSAQMTPTKLILQLSPSTYGQAAIYDTFSISGGSTILRTSYPLQEGYWQLYVSGLDQRDVQIYSGSSWFYVTNDATTNLGLTLDAQYSSLQVRFPVIDSLVRFSLAVDGSIWSDTSLDGTTGVGDTILVDKDYLLASSWGYYHTFSLKAWALGDTGQKLAYKLDTSLYVVSGQDLPMMFNLKWVGDGLPPGGRANLSVSLGRVGKVSILATYGVKEPTIPWNGSVFYGSLYDYRDGHIYRTIQTGSQVWMAENLAYRGTGNDSIGHCYNDDTLKCATYGRLYNWSEVSTFDSLLPGDKGICPYGSHVPTESDWTQLFAWVADSANSASLLKSSRAWNDGGNGSDFIGFRALPAGYRYEDSVSTSGGLGSITYFWSSTETGANTAWSPYLSATGSQVETTVYLPKDKYFSLRCILDQNY